MRNAIGSPRGWMPLLLLAFAALYPTGAQGGQAPLAVVCAGDITVECTSHNGTVVTYPAGHCVATGGIAPVSLSYSPPSGSTFPIGTTLVVATATDGTGATATHEFNVHVVDTIAPTVVLRMGVSQLWPPNHKMQNVGLRVRVTDACDDNPTVSIKVFADEDDQELTGGGGHSPDAAPGHDFPPTSLPLSLRAERKGSGDGRVYLILVTAVDESGNVGHACAAVVVPHSQSKNAKRSVLAQATAAVRHCDAFGTPPAGFFPVGDGPVARR